MPVVYKYIEIVGTSPKGFNEAVQNAVKEAAKTVRGISWIEVLELRGSVKGARIAEYQAITKIGFKVER